MRQRAADGVRPRNNPGANAPMRLADDLEAFLEGRLSREETRHVVRHLIRGCLSCAAQLRRGRDRLVDGVPQKRVAEREKKDGFRESQPQMSVGANIREALEAWRWRRRGATMASR